MAPVLFQLAQKSCSLVVSVDPDSGQVQLWTRADMYIRWLHHVESFVLLFIFYYF